MLHRHYVDEGMTTYAIANKVGCPDQTVATALALHSIARRRRR